MGSIDSDKQQKLPKHVKSKAAIKELFSEQLKTSLPVYLSIEECMDKITEEDRRNS